MARLKWNFAVPRRASRLCIGVSALGLAACLHAVLWRHQLMQQRDQVIVDLTAAAQHFSPRKRSTPPPPAALEAVFREMRSPWTGVLESLQRVTRPGVDLITLQPDGNDARRIHISGVASRAQDVIELLETLQADRSWSAVQLVNQMTAGNAGTSGSASPGIPTLPGLSPAEISFSLVAEWAQP